MILLALLAPFVVLTTRVVGGPISNINNHFSIPITKQTNNGGKINIVQNDINRSKFLMKSGQQYGSRIPDISLNEQIDNGYLAIIGVGDPPQYFNLLVDTGSSNTWVGANKTYIPTKSSIETPDSFNVTYGTGQVNGTEFIDDVTIAPGVVIYQQSIGVALNSTGFNGSDGILGIGPTNLTLGTTFPDNTTLIPTVVDNLVSQGKIKKNVIGVSFEPSNSTSDINMNGELNFGGTDPTRYIGDITYHNLTDVFPASDFFGLDASFQYGNELILNNSPGIIDTGTTLIGLSMSAYNRYMKATGAIYDNATQLLRITLEQYNKLKPLYFIVDDITYELNQNAQILPRTANTLLGGDNDHLYLIVFDLGQLEASGLEYIAGMAYLQRYYSVYDRDCPSVGFSRTPFTDATDIN